MKQSAVIVFILISVIAGAQTAETVAYSREYDFKEGVFLTIGQFKSNNPVPRSAIISGVPKDQVDFMTQVMDFKTFTYKDSAGIEQKLETDAVWGYCQNRNICINFNNECQRVNVIGTWSLFSAIITKAPIRGDPMSDMYAMSTSYQELHQFVYDMQTGKATDFTVKNMELLLESDPELHTQFMKLKKRAKSDSIFIYLRKYNEKHPLYLSAK